MYLQMLHGVAEDSHAIQFSQPADVPARPQQKSKIRHRIRCVRINTHSSLVSPLPQVPGIGSAELPESNRRVLLHGVLFNIPDGEFQQKLDNVRVQQLCGRSRHLQALPEAESSISCHRLILRAEELQQRVTFWRGRKVPSQAPGKEGRVGTDQTALWEETSRLLHTWGGEEKKIKMPMNRRGLSVIK